MADLAYEEVGPAYVFYANTDAGRNFLDGNDRAYVEPAAGKATAMINKAKDLGLIVEKMD